MQDVKSKYLTGGQWKKAYFAKLGKHRHETTRKGRVYIAVPPPEGWPGGLEVNNGYKKRGG